MNVAARLEQAAAPGEIYVGEQTHAAVCGAALLEALARPEAKRKREPLRAWRLVAVRPDAPGLARSIGTPFVGRRQKLDHLRQAFDTVPSMAVSEVSQVVGRVGIEPTTKGL